MNFIGCVCWTSFLDNFPTEARVSQQVSLQVGCVRRPRMHVWAFSPPPEVISDASLTKRSEQCTFMHDYVLSMTAERFWILLLTHLGDVYTAVVNFSVNMCIFKSSTISRNWNPFGLK